MSPPLPAGAACGWETLDVPRVLVAPRSVTAHPCHICLPRSAHPAWAAVVVAWGFVPPMFHTPGVEMEKREMWGFGGMYFVLCFFFLVEATCGAACAGVGVGLAGGADVWSGWCRWGGNGADGAMLGVPAAAGLPVTFCLQLFRRSFLEPCHRLGPQPARRVPGLRRAAGGAGQGAGTGGGPGTATGWELRVIFTDICQIGTFCSISHFCAVQPGPVPNVLSSNPKARHPQPSPAHLRGSDPHRYRLQALQKPGHLNRNKAGAQNVFHQEGSKAGMSPRPQPPAWCLPAAG